MVQILQQTKSMPGEAKVIQKILSIMEEEIAHQSQCLRVHLLWEVKENKELLMSGSLIRGAQSPRSLKRILTKMTQHVEVA